MKKAFLAAAALVISMSPPVVALGASADNAPAIEDILRGLLPEGSRDGLTVERKDDRFEVKLDIVKLLGNAMRPFATFKSATPVIQYLTPLDDGLWKVQGDQSLDFAFKSNAGGQTSDVSYKIGGLRYDGVFDPAITYFRNMTATMTDVEMVMNSDLSSSAVTIEEANYNLFATDFDPQATDIVGSGQMMGFHQTIVDPKTGHINFDAGKATIDVRIDNLKTAAIRDIVNFALARRDKKDLTIAEKEQLRDLARKGLPFWARLNEDIEVSDITVTAKGMTFNADAFRYGIDFDGLSNDAQFSVNLSVDNPGVPAGLLPPNLEAALPEEVSVEMAIEGLALSNAATYFLDHANLRAREPLTQTEQDELREIVLPGGQMKVAFRDMRAKSSVFDFSAEGSMIVYPEEKGRQSAHLVVHARDLDKTVAFLQKNAAAVPKFGQAAFVALMMKGFAVSEADGRLKWDIEVSEDKSVSINGQSMAFP